MGAVEIWPWLGLDSLLAGLVLSSRQLSWRESSALAVAFGTCDASASAFSPILTSAAPHLLWMAVYLLAVLLVGYMARASRLALVVLPLGLSVDNLFGHSASGDALLSGLSSGLLALLGLQLPGLALFLLTTTFTGGSHGCKTQCPYPRAVPRGG
jgi:hypothetical protein